MPPQSSLIPKILHEFHSWQIGGHSCIERTLKSVKQAFWWEKMEEHVKDYIYSCHTCQTIKIPTLRSQGLLVPLPVLDAIWQDVLMDFIVGLPVVKRKSAIRNWMAR